MTLEIQVVSLTIYFALFERLIKLDEAFPGANIILHKTGSLPQVLMYK
jgi:hypothetical protein